MDIRYIYVMLHNSQLCMYNCTCIVTTKQKIYKCTIELLLQEFISHLMLPNANYDTYINTETCDLLLLICYVIVNVKIKFISSISSTAYCNQGCFSWFDITSIVSTPLQEWLSFNNIILSNIKQVWYAKQSIGKKTRHVSPTITPQADRS